MALSILLAFLAALPAAAQVVVLPQVPVAVGIGQAGAAVAGPASGMSFTLPSVVAQVPSLTAGLPAGTPVVGLMRGPMVPILPRAVRPEARPSAVAVAPASGRFLGVPPVAGQVVIGNLPDPTALVRPAQAAGTLPQLDLSAFDPGRFAQLPAGGVHAAGAQLMDQVLQVRSRGGEDVPGDYRPAPRRKKAADGLKKKPAPPGGEAPAPKKAKHVIEPGVFSPNRLKVFERDPEEYALTYIFGVEDPAPKGYELLVGLAVHRTMETVFGQLKAGRPPVAPAEAVALYDKYWEEGLAEGHWKAKEGWTPSDFQNRGRSFIERRLSSPVPADEKILSLEDELRWTVTDPATGKDYAFKGTIDRLTVRGDTVYIHDWKTHFSPPSLEQLRRDDYQLGLYALALRRTRPDLVAGKKIRLVWDFKEFSQEIEADDAYLTKVQERVLSLIHGVETFTERVEAERPQWAKRLKPDAKPKGLKAAKGQVDAMGLLAGELDQKRAELRRLRAEHDGLESGLTAWARTSGAESARGSAHTVAFERPEGKVLPTKTDDPEGHAAVEQVLKESGVWDRYSSLSPVAVRAMAEVQGHPDHEAFGKIRAHLGSRHADEVELEANEDAQAPARRGGGVAPSRIARDRSGDAGADAEPGLYSPHQLGVFAKDPKAFARQYLFRVKEGGPKTMDILVGLAVHETLEEVFTWLKGGRPAKDVSLDDALTFYGERWEELLAAGAWKPEPGVTAEEHKHRGELYIRGKWQEMYPFVNQGRAVYLEKRMHFTVADPATGKTYKFQGIPDRVMLEGDTLVIRDWKTHWIVPAEKEFVENDFQLGLYVLALRQLFPDLVRGRKVRLVWDFRDRTYSVDADEAYLAKIRTKVLGLLNGVDALRADVDRDPAKWQALARPQKVPVDAAEAGRWADALGASAAKVKENEEEVRGLQARYDETEAAVAAFARATGRVRVEGGTFTATLRKKGVVDVPTKTKDRQAYDALVAELKKAGVWGRYSQMDYSALKKALADPDSPDRAVLLRLEPLLKAASGVKVKLAR